MATTPATTAPTAGATTLQSLVYDDGGDDVDMTKNKRRPSLQVLDQLLLPDESKYINVPDIQTTWRVIKDMNIRGKDNMDDIVTDNVTDGRSGRI